MTKDSNQKEQLKGMMYCKSCGKEISKKAIICPGCGAKMKTPVYKKWWFYLIIILVIGIGAGESSNTSNTNSSTLVSSNNDIEKETVYNIGDTVSTDKFELTLTKVETKSKVGTEYFNSTPAEGGIYVAVKWKYKNISKEPINSWNTPILYLYDSNDTRYSSDISASSNYATEVYPDRKILSDLNPGISTTDADVFEISKDSYENGEWFIEIDADTEVKFKIK